MIDIINKIFEAYNEEAWSGSDSNDSNFSNAISSEIINRNMGETNKTIQIELIFDFLNRDIDLFSSFCHSKETMNIFEVTSYIQNLFINTVFSKAMGFPNLNNLPFFFKGADDLIDDPSIEDFYIPLHHFPGDRNMLGNPSWVLNYLEDINLIPHLNTSYDGAYTYIVNNILAGFAPIKPIDITNRFFEDFFSPSVNGKLLSSFYEQKWNQLSKDKSNMTSFQVLISWEFYRTWLDKRTAKNFELEGMEVVDTLDIIQIENTGILMRFPVPAIDNKNKLSPKVVNSGSFITFIPYAPVTIYDIERKLKELQ